MNVIYIFIHNKFYSFVGKRMAKNQNEDELLATSQIVSLRDAVSLQRIITPLKSRNCQHLQCFDGDTFLTMNAKKAVVIWVCPKCSKAAPFDSLVYDG